MSDKTQNADELIGQTIAGRYRIISRLGAGGMGVAYRAWDEEEEVPVVIKIPKRIFLDDPKFAERFAREIRLLQGLRHPHIVPIVDVGEHEGLPYVAMRFLPGGSLSDRRLRGDDRKPRPNPPGMLHLWLPSIAEALDHVHANGVVHRDVKPGNIFFDAFWNAFLGDFGIAKIVEESESFDRENTLTATNMGIGTQEYMGPEQFTPKPVLDGRTDQYALAVMVYEMLAGTRPFTGTTAHLIIEVTTQPVPPLDRQRWGLPASLVQAVHRGLAKNPGERFSSCREFAYEVLRDVPLLADEPDIARLLCPKCSNILKLPVKAAGQKGKCPKCQTTMKVADDLGALWRLDEARRQRRSQVTVVDVEDIEEDREPVDTGSEIDEAALEAFKPVSSTTPIERAARRKAKKPSTGMILGGVAATAVALAGLLMGFSGGRPTPPSPPTYEQQLAQAEEKGSGDPDDKAANDFLGRHWCFKKDDWKKGLPYLAKSGAIGLWNTAKKQLDLEAANRVASPGDKVRLAMDWWTLSGQKTFVSAAEAEAIKKHAAGIYLAAVDGLTNAKDIEDTNRWLDRNTDFLAILGGRRPPKVKLATAAESKRVSAWIADTPIASRRSHFFHNRMSWEPIGGKKYANTIHIHPEVGSGKSQLVYQIDKKYEEINGAIGVLDMAKRVASPQVFRIVGDGKELWKSAPFKQTGKGEAFRANVSGVKTLELLTDCTGSKFDAHCVWIEPQLVATREQQTASVGVPQPPTDASPQELLEFAKGLLPPKQAPKSREEMSAYIKAASRVAVEAADKVLTSVKEDEELFAKAAKLKLESLSALGRLGEEQAAADMATFAANLAESPVKTLAKEGKRMLIVAKAQQMFSRGKFLNAEVLVAETAALLESDPDDTQTAGLATQLVGALERVSAGEKVAVAAIKTFSTLFLKSSNERIRQLAKGFEGKLRLLELPGKPMEITGSLLDGSPFVQSKFTGKVILVLFWTTWCGPCVTEISGILKEYEKYHQLGFEVVGISLDEDKAKVEKFVADNKIPWPILFAGKGWRHPMAEFYGISGVPELVLIGRDGKVITLDVRGGKLGEKLAELFKDSR